MYSTCIFCNRALETNDVLEPFPIGRRLAYDAEKGRLWVVCRRCERWNLTPLEERWEAIEECERRYRDTRIRVATENIGLARIWGGLELVRIGDPLRPEFAAWRYGDQFGRRRRRAIVIGSAIGAAGAAVIAGATVAGVSLGGFAYGWQGLANAYRENRVVARTKTGQGGVLKVKGKHLVRSSLYPDDGEPGWAFELAHADGTQQFRGPEAIRIAGKVLAGMNWWGGSRRNVQAAVARIEAAGHPTQYFIEASRDAEHRRVKKLGKGKSAKSAVAAGSLRALPLDVRLALEMATQEEAERRALAEDLTMLESAWREAEELAAIADNLVTPSSADEWIRSRRAKTSSSGP